MSGKPQRLSDDEYWDRLIGAGYTDADAARAVCTWMELEAVSRKIRRDTRDPEARRILAERRDELSALLGDDARELARGLSYDPYDAIPGRFETSRARH